MDTRRTFSKPLPAARAETLARYINDPRADRLIMGGWTLGDVQAVRGMVRRQIEGYAGGDRPPSPPVTLLRLELALDALYEGARSGGV